jgi:hypothetical protein
MSRRASAADMPTAPGDISIGRSRASPRHGSQGQEVSRCGPGETFASWRTRCAMDNLDDAGAHRCAGEFLRKPHAEPCALSLIQMAGIAGIEPVNVLLHHRFRWSVIVIGDDPHLKQGRPWVWRGLFLGRPLRRALIGSCESAPCALEALAVCPVISGQPDSAG